MVEIEGTVGQIGVGKYRQLRDYVDDDHTETGDLKKGILVGNGFMASQPAERGDQFSVGAIRGAGQQGFCLLSTTELFKLVQRALETPSDDIKSELRAQLLGHVGVFKA